MAPTLPLGIRRLHESRLTHPEGVAGEVSLPSAIFAGPTNVSPDSAAIAILGSTLPTFFGPPALISTLWQPTLVHESSAVLVVPRKAEDLASQAEWLRLPWVERPKENHPMDDFWGIPGLFGDTGGDSWNP